MDSWIHKSVGPDLDLQDSCDCDSKIELSCAFYTSIHLFLTLSLLATMFVVC